MSLIDRKHAYKYLVLSESHYDDANKVCGCIWYRYTNATNKLQGEASVEKVELTWKGDNYPLTYMTTDAERVSFYHSKMKEHSGGKAEKYNGTDTQLAQREAVANLINDATQFGHDLLEEFAAENVLSGITQAGMTATVRKNCSEIVSALSTGSLYDAVDQAKELPVDKKDAVFLTDVRLLAFVNKIENYLGVTLSTEL